MNTAMNKMMKSRGLIVLGLMGLFLIYVFSTLFKESILNEEFYKEYGTHQQMSVNKIKAERGTIYDTNMKILAQSASVWNVDISPNIVQVKIGSELTDKQKKIIGMTEEEYEAWKKSELKLTDDQKTLLQAEYEKEVAKDLSELLDVDYDKVLSKIKKENQYEIIKTDLEKPLADKVRELKVEKGYNFININESTKRFYPNNELASNVLGFVNYENKGAYGLEAQYNSVLEGIDGKLITATDARGNQLPKTYEQTYEAIDGSDVILTIDSVIQNYAEKALDDLVQQNNPVGGASAIVMDVNTGAVLAMANTDGYNLNDHSSLYSDRLKEFSKNPVKLDASGCPVLDSNGNQISLDLDKDALSEYNNTLQQIQWGNKAIGWTSEPGSVAKVVTGSAALEEGVATMNSEFYCKGSVTIVKTPFHCHETSGHGKLDFTGAIVNSCNPAFIEMGLGLGAEKYFNYFDMFGFTKTTGIDLPGEQKGSYYTADNLGVVELASSSFGQTFTVTPLQMLTATAAVVNGGYLVQPHVMQQVVDNEGNVTQTAQTNTTRQVISQETSAQMREAMVAMVSANGGSTAYVKGYEIGGKSGTAQKSNKKIGYKVSSFVGFAPADDPQVAVIVTADSPTGRSEYGSAVAGPAVGSIFADTLPYLGILPQYTVEDASAMEALTPNVLNKNIEDAKNTIANSGLKVEVVGNGKTVVAQSPQKNMLIAKDGKIILYTEESYKEKTVVVPNLVGKTLTQANKALTDLGLNISFDGSSTKNMNLKITEQSIAPKTKIDVGSAVSVKYSSTLND